MASPAAQTNDFSVGSVRRAVLRMAVPITLAQLINILYNLVDRMYIGHIPGAGALALTGLGLCLPVISIVMAFARIINGAFYLDPEDHYIKFKITDCYLGAPPSKEAIKFNVALLIRTV